MHRPRVAITVGDPAGIGPEIAAKAAADPRVLEVLRADRLSATAMAPDFPPGVLSADAGRAAYELIVRAVNDAHRWSGARRSPRRR